MTHVSVFKAYTYIRKEFNQVKINGPLLLDFKLVNNQKLYVTARGTSESILIANNSDVGQWWWEPIQGQEDLWAFVDELLGEVKNAFRGKSSTIEDRSEFLLLEIQKHFTDLNLSNAYEP